MNKFKKIDFGEEFHWGVSAAAFQTEGACYKDGKGQSIWDEFTTRKGKILNGETALTACDFYHRYQEDIDIVKQLNIPNFRFSISWTRILPEGTGEVNQAGIDYYNKVIDYCLQQGVEPWLTLYHWDLPYALELKGGWTNREVVNWFGEFVNICADSFGDRVKYWMVMNEPSVFTGAGYFLGIHAPGRTGLKNFIPAIHHAVLAMATGGRILKQKLLDAEIGTTFSCSHIEPHTQRHKDIAAAKRADALINRLFIEPILGLGYPDNVPALKKIKNYFQAGDEEAIKFDFDFIGLQNYTREIVQYSFFTPYIGARLVKAKDRNVPLTDMGWEVHPPSIYYIIKKYSAYSNIKKILITENGAAFPDKIEQNEVDDPKRLAYIHDMLEQVLKAKNEGCNVQGYFVWTLTDNFEWAEGYHPRFGLVHVDFDTLKRTIKNSGHWYRELLGEQ
ncbi:GH1 family beta-glucosidase [Mucilaginibacter sp. KACC 22063]|uniref:GH1 family beta-glucosidase n=1 Tax=Mucilaginibacter sp. KACC 22063 TaxID=3025666 RepID=UPI0023651AEB|nr:GH1 family beta-glucosidase [Mucilaginibacter sp. KACC 22063]WDF53620.1 GH1 family beta-glucosidase [Mucilaginibacter sp. KACC 22063]